MQRLIQSTVTTINRNWIVDCRALLPTVVLVIPPMQESIWQPS